MFARASKFPGRIRQHEVKPVEKRLASFSIRAHLKHKLPPLPRSTKNKEAKEKPKMMFGKIKVQSMNDLIK